MIRPRIVPAFGLIVPKPGTRADWQHGDMPDLGQNLRQRQFASTADDGGCYPPPLRLNARVLAAVLAVERGGNPNWLYPSVVSWQAATTAAA
jgi:hypothetical protein